MATEKLKWREKTSKGCAKKTESWKIRQQEIHCFMIHSNVVFHEKK